MTDLSRIEELLLKLVNQQERMIDRLDRIEATLNDTARAMSQAVPMQLQTLGQRVDNLTSTLTSELDWTNGNSFGYQVVHQMLPAKEHSFAAQALDALDQIRARLDVL